MDFIFDLPLIVIGPVLIAILVGTSLVSLNWFRRHQLPRLRFGEGDVEFGAAMLASIMVFYGLATALTAVQVWESYEKVKEITAQEASSMAAFYRNVSQYPEPLRSTMREQIRGYTYQIIHDSWPLQRQGTIPTETVRTMDELQTTLVGFEPKTEAEKGLALETLASYDRMMEARRMRLTSVDRKLPGVLWVVIILGAFISLVSAFYFPVHDERIHRVQVGLLAGFIGLVIFMIVALDRPYRGDLGVKPRPYEILYEQLMAH
jgi:uncharacterized membrane protein